MKVLNLGRMDRSVIILGTIVLASLAMAIARQLSERNNI
jgi:hypothetical protein